EGWIGDQIGAPEEGVHLILRDQTGPDDAARATPRELRIDVVRSPPVRPAQYEPVWHVRGNLTVGADQSYLILPRLQGARTQDVRGIDAERSQRFRWVDGGHPERRCERRDGHARRVDPVAPLH